MSSTGSVYQTTLFSGQNILNPNRKDDAERAAVVVRGGSCCWWTRSGHSMSGIRVDIKDRGQTWWSISCL